MSLLNAYDYDSYISMLSSNSFLSPYKLDSKSESLLLELVHLTDKIEHIEGDERRREFYIHLPSPTLAYYTKKERQGVEKDEYEEYGVDDKHIKEYFAESYPDEDKWYEISISHEEANGRYPEFIAVFINHNYLLSYNDPNAKGQAIDASGLIEDLIEKTANVVSRLKAGTYNSYIDKNLPVRKRYGVIHRKDYYDIYPEAREQLHENLTEQDIEDLANNIGNEHEVPKNAYKEMTARKYFEAAAIGIQSVKYKHQKNPWMFDKETHDEVEKYKGSRFDGSTPRLIYMSNADGRDDGLTNLPLDSSEAFEEWQHHKGPYYVFNGTHPWEIRTSMSISLSIHLFPHHDQQSGLWYFVLTGDAYTTCNETVHYYLAMKRAGIPVVLEHSEHIIARFLETDNIGIVPDTLSTFLATNVPDDFDGENVGDVVNLPDEKEECQKVLEKVRWLKIPEVCLSKA